MEHAGGATKGSTAPKGRWARMSCGRENDLLDAGSGSSVLADVVAAVHRRRASAPPDSQGWAWAAVTNGPGHGTGHCLICASISACIRIVSSRAAMTRR